LVTIFSGRAGIGTLNNTGTAQTFLTTSQSLSSGVWFLMYQAAIYSASTVTYSNITTFLANSSTVVTNNIITDGTNNITNAAKVTTGSQTATGSNSVVQQCSSCILTLPTSASITIWGQVTANQQIEVSGTTTSSGQGTYIMATRIA